MATGKINRPKQFIMETGYFTENGIAAKSYRDHRINYTKNFPYQPNVIVTLNTGSTESGMGSTTLGTLSGSETGVTIRIYNNDTAGRNPSVQWAAICEL